MPIQPSKRKTSDRAYYLFALRIVGDFGIAIAVPAVLGAVLGRTLDEKYHRASLFTVLCLIVAFLITISIVYKKAKYYGNEYQKMK